jgi:ribosomal protein L11 methyltransferase
LTPAGSEAGTPPGVAVMSFDTTTADIDTIGDLSARCWLLGCTGIEEQAGSILVTFPDLATALAAGAALGWPLTGPAIEVTDPLRDWVAPMDTVTAGRFEIRPADQRPADRPDRAEPESRVMTIDPGRAFGSGSHPSTRAALELLGRGRPPTHVLDVGTGTGILAIAAAAIGASSVRAIDVDPVAITCARANVIANGVETVVEVDDAPIGTIDARFDMALVNLTIDIHEAVAADVTERLDHRATVIAAGVLVGDQQSRLERAYPTLVAADRCDVGEWVALRLVTSRR